MGKISGPDHDPCGRTQDQGIWSLVFRALAVSRQTVLSLFRGVLADG